MSTERYTDGAYLRAHPGWHREHSEWKAQQILRLLKRHGLEPRSVVEVGCGAGGILVAMQRELAASTRFTGYEIAADAVRLAQPLANERLEFVLGDFLATPTRGLDLLLVIDVVEHIRDYLGFLTALRERARWHVFHLPLDLSLLSCLQPERLRWAFESVGHLHSFTAETALAALSNTGYVVRDHVFTAVELDLPPAQVQQQRLRFLRRLGRRISPAWAARLLGGFSVLVLCENPEKGESC